MFSFLASSDTSKSRAKRYTDGMASTAMLGHPYNLFCFPKDARRSKVTAMIVQLESCTILPIASRSSTTRKARYMLKFSKKGLPYRKVFIDPNLPLHHIHKTDAAMPFTIGTVPQPAKLVKTDSPSVKQFDDRLHGENLLSYAQLEYASCSAKGCSCTNPSK